MNIRGQHDHAARDLALAVFASTLLGCTLDSRPSPAGPPAVPEQLVPAYDSIPSEVREYDAGASTLGMDASLTPLFVVDAASPTPAAKPIDDDGDAGPIIPSTPEAPTSDCSSSAQRFVAVAQTHCVSCHGPAAPAAGSITNVLDLPALVSSGAVVPENPDRSPLFREVSSGAMPPAAGAERLSAQELASVRAWIDCGAPNAAPAPACQSDCIAFVDIPTRLHSILYDLETLEPSARSGVRYLDLSHYANAGHHEEQIERYRGALSYAVNSLSRAAAIVPPLAIDAQSLLFRIQLSDYGWTAASWELLAAEYPYGVTYDPNSRTFPIDDTLLARMRAQTATSTPYIQADWFFSHVMRPPLYYDLLGVPENLRGLELQLGVDIQADIDNQRVARAGFQDSGPSHFNRVIERHALSEDRGALWLTYDFDAGSGFSNILTHPLDFRHTSSEILFSLPNGLHGYMIVDARGARLAKAPNAAVQDAQANDFAIEGGISCTNCHLEAGVNARRDEVRRATTLSTTDLVTADAVLALYKDDATLDAAFAADHARYRSALGAAQPRTFATGSAHQLDGAYAGLLSAKDIAGLLGIREAQLTEAISGSPGVFPAEVLVLRTPGGKLPRDQVEATFPRLVSALGLGVPQRK